MEDAFKKFLYAGVELASTAAENFQNSVTDMVENNKISSEEGKEKVDEFFEKTKNKLEEFENKFNSVAERLDFSKSNDDELDSLRKKVADLESKIGKSTKSKATV